MLEPTPVLPTSPADLRAVFNGALTVMKARFGTFAPISLAPIAMQFAASTALLYGVNAILPQLIDLDAGRTPAPSPGANLLWLWVALSIVQLFVTAKAAGMTSLGAYEAAQGKTSSFGSLWRETSRFLPRISPVIGIGVVIVMVLAVVLIFALAAAAVAAMSKGSSPSSAMVGVLGVVLVALPALVYLALRLVYLVPVIAIEPQPTLPAVRRTWQLTRGAVGRILGYSLVALVMTSSLSTIVSGLVQSALAPAVEGLSQPATPQQLAAVFPTLVPAYLILLAAQALVQVITVPFLNSFLAVMYLDQRRRSDELTTPPPPGWAPPTWTTPPPPPPNWPPTGGPQG